ncbi:galaxin-like [Pecten maximus]|uniref:galaxin-like n=1 Tax=Pecten maximus TaxID=6579 RepID=UPI0014589964|nr:galaxin-like [Pecten maximus]
MVVRKNNTSGRKETCCGSEVIDLLTHGCCANKHTYNNFEYCCGETVVYSREMCCGRTKLNDDQVCCNESNTVFPVKKQHKFHDSCCNGKSYKRAAENCPAADDRTPRCGTEAWDSNKDICCNNRLYKGKNMENITCCGAYILNTSYQECIHGRPKDRTMKNKGSKRNVQLCGKKKKNTVQKRKDRCCKNHFHKNAKLNGLWCCGAAVYNKTSQKCCSNKVVPLNSTICKKRHRRYDPQNYPSMKCSSAAWLRARVLKNMDCIQHAYLMKRKSRGRNYRIKKDLVQEKNKSLKRTTWSAKPFCKHVLNRKRFILIIISSSEVYTLKFSKKSRALIERLPPCDISG